MDDGRWERRDAPMRGSLSSHAGRGRGEGPIAYRPSLIAASSAERVVVIDDQRRVVGEALVDVDRRRACPRRDAGRGDLVVDAPADVLLPRLATVRPPGVALGPRV